MNKVFETIKDSIESAGELISNFFDDCTAIFKKESKFATVTSRAVDVYGARPQTIKAIEELSELSQALCKDLNGKGDKNNIAEEMADCLIMLSQLVDIYNNDEDVDKWIDIKIDRLELNIKYFVNPKE